MQEIKISLFAFMELLRKEPPKQSPEERIRHFASIYANYKDQDAKQQASRCIDCGIPYCKWKCPVYNHIPQWLRLVAEDKIIQAADLAHETNTLPEVCGRICPQELLCEGACTLNGFPGAVTIGAIEQYLTEKALSMGWQPDLSKVQKINKKVAVIGAGPAGLGCADRLIRGGADVVVYDRYPEIGGLLTFGIPEFKLEKKVIQRRRKILEAMGIKFQLNTDIGKTIAIEELIAQYDALFLGLGADKDKNAGIEGETLSGVYKALPFLINKILEQFSWSTQKAVNLKNKRVIILGAGDTAMDCTRTALRSGATSAHCVYHRSECNRKGSLKDYKLALEEGAQFLWNKQAIAFKGKDRVEAIEFINTDVNKENQIVLIPNTEQLIPVDVVITAYGFDANPPHWLNAIGVNTKTSGLIDTDILQPVPLQTSNPKLFAGGDMVLGADLVVRAIAQGHSAAKSILQYLSGPHY